MNRSIALLPLAALLVLVAASPGARSEGGAEVAGPVPTPSGVAAIAVRVGDVRAFPWSGVTICPRPFTPGCFVVSDLAPERVVLSYARVAVEGGMPKPQGFRYRTPVTAAGSPYELFTIKLGGGREEWVYAALESIAAESAIVRFLKLPAFVTERARLDVRVVLEPGRRLRETYVVETDERLTLIGLGDVGAVFPSGRLERIAVNGQAVQGLYRDIIHLNLGPGRHEVAVDVGLGSGVADLTLQGTLLEPRKMSLVRSLELRVEPRPGVAPDLEVRTVGVPPDVWERFKSTIAADPAPTAETARPLAVQYRFSTSSGITLRVRPRIPLGPNNYPVMITVTAPSRE